MNDKSESGSQISEHDRMAYLDAMGIDVWRPRDADEPEDMQAAEAQVDVATLDWSALQGCVAECTACSLHETRTQTVFGVGSTSADWMIIGEAPGQEEDRQGEPFVGRAGKLLDQMLIAIGLDRSSVYIANVLKCRPPNNRDPSQEEAAACRRFLERQIDLIQPKIVLAVGRIAAQKLLGSDAPLGRMRGQQHFLKDGTLPVVVTYHPAYLLRSPSQKAKAWQDLRQARQIVNER
jgi:uracil-DNA glycosylase family 4